MILQLLADAEEQNLYLDRTLQELADEAFSEIVQELQQLEKNGKIDLSEKFPLENYPSVYKLVKDIENRQWRRFTDWCWMGAQVIKESMTHTYKETLNQTFELFKPEYTIPHNGVLRLHEPLLPQIQITDTYIVDHHIRIPWCQDGKIYSDRLYGHVANFQSKLSFVLEEGIKNGKGYDWMLKAWRKLTGSTAYDAARLLKTETMAMWSEATKEAYLSMGIEMVEIVNPAPCDEVCSDYVGEVIPLAEAELGDQLPPYHPNCLCEYFAYYEETDSPSEATVIDEE